MRKIWSILTLSLVAAGLQAMLAVPASADTRAGVTGGNLIVSASALANTITLDSANGDVILTDAGDDVAASRGCLKTAANQVRCSGVTTIQLNLGDGDDEVTNNTAVNTIVRGGKGDDTLNGGSAADRFVGGPGSDTLLGNDGNDSLEDAGFNSGDDTLNGGRGTDTCIADSGDTKLSCER